MESIQESEISFNVGSEKVSFKIYHNLFDYGLDIEIALNSWLARTDNYTDVSFCEYLLSKEVGYLCYTEKEYKTLLKNGF